MCKKLLMVTLAAAVGASVSCSKPRSDKDKISYTIGVQFGKNLKSQEVQVDAKMLGHGVKDAMSGKLQMTDEEMQATMMKMNEDRQKEMAASAEKNKKSAAEFLEKHKGTEGVKTTASGLQYKIVSEGTGPAPKESDVVSVHYKGTLTDGTEFDSSYKRNAPAEFPLKGVIPGWTEGLQLMKKGGKAQFWIPPELAYGDRPRPGIPSNSVLAFEVELLDVKKEPAKAKK